VTNLFGFVEQLYGASVTAIHHIGEQHVPMLCDMQQNNFQHYGLSSQEYQSNSYATTIRTIVVRTACTFFLRFFDFEIYF